MITFLLKVIFYPTQPLYQLLETPFHVVHQGSPGISKIKDLLFSLVTSQMLNKQTNKQTEVLEGSRRHLYLVSLYKTAVQIQGIFPCRKYELRKRNSACCVYQTNIQHLYKAYIGFHSKQAVLEKPLIFTRGQRAAYPVSVISCPIPIFYHFTANTVTQNLAFVQVLFLRKYTDKTPTKSTAFILVHCSA